jgi:4-hydroxybenzoyl-CoA thioesterase
MRTPLSYFVLTRTIKFADVDPARIVFYPRYFEMINETVEEWFRQDLGCDFSRMTAELDCGVPLVRREAEFLNPGHLYDDLELRLSPTRLGASSVSLVVEAIRGETCLFVARLVLVYMDLKKQKSLRWPGALRQRIAAALPSTE